jgi:hypothetical protein
MDKVRLDKMKMKEPVNVYVLFLCYKLSWISGIEESTSLKTWTIMSTIFLAKWSL